jgi:hypothetical protein
MNREVRKRYTPLKNRAREFHPHNVPDVRVTSGQEACKELPRHYVGYSIWLELGMFEWRHGVGDPKKTLKVVVETALRAARLLAPFLKPPHYRLPFHFAPALFLSRLTHRRFHPEIVGLLPAFESWNASRRFITYCDRAHLMAIKEGQYPKKWPKLISAFRNEPQLLTADTHECYAEIVTLCHHQQYVEAIDQIRRATELYKKRAQNFGYRNTWMSEGGSFNSDCVDYRLAAIVEHFFAKRKKLLNDLPQDHLWRF